MKIAIATDGKTRQSPVVDPFEQSSHLLIVETDDGHYECFSYPERQENAPLAMIEEILKRDCEALISGSLEKPSFEALAEAQITRYLGTGQSAEDALALMEANQLAIIRAPHGETWVPHQHDSGTCRHGDHEDLNLDREDEV